MKFKLFLTNLLVFIAISCYSQTEKKTESDLATIPDTDFHEIPGVTVKPKFPGGEKAMYAYIGKNIVYPKKAFEKEIEGIVVVEFTINKKGKVVDVVSKSQIDADLKKEAIRVVKSLPDWQPGIMDKRPVNVRYSIPLNFSL